MKKNFNVVKRAMAMVAVVGVMCSAVEVDAASVSARKAATLRLYEIADYGATLWSVVKMDTTAMEYYDITSAQKLKYKKRTLYATFDGTTSQTSWSPVVVPIRHANSDGTVTQEFETWNKVTDSITPDVDSVYYVQNGKDVTYKASTGKKAIWSVGLYGENAFVPFTWASSEPYSMSLKYSSK